MNAGISKEHKTYIFVTTVFLALTYESANLLDSVLEHENIAEHLFAPPRLLLLLFILLGALYMLRLLIRHRALERSSTLQSAAIESSIDGIAIFDANYELAYSNKAHTRLYGYHGADELIGKSWRFFYGEEEIARFQEEVKPSLIRKGEWRGETIGRRKDGSTFPLEVSLTRMKDGGIIRIVRDNSEKKRYQLELERKAQELTATNSELHAFSYSLSHDMRSHITRISAAAQMLLDRYVHKMDADGKYLVNSINKSWQEMSQLLESIQLLASISHTTPSIEVVNLSEVVTEIATQLQLAAPGRAADFIIAPGVSAHCDASLARIALDNLLENAWKYTGKVTPARIEFGLEQAGEKQLLFIRDNGVGFGMEDADKLFEPFLRLQNARIFPGTGIGLATVQRVIQLHKGELWCVGEPEKGATFYFSFAENESPSSPTR